MFELPTPPTRPTGVSPFQVVRDFENALCQYTGAPYAVTTTSCTMALLLAVAWCLRTPKMPDGRPNPVKIGEEIEIPKYTYVGVPMSIVHAGGKPVFRDDPWVGAYQLRPLPVWDSARLLTGGMYVSWPRVNEIFPFVCVSFHWTKTLGIQQGGAILHGSPEADAWLRRARFDGRTEGVHPANDSFPHLGWHAYMSPETAAAGLVRLATLPRSNPPLPWDGYGDLSKLDLFK